MAEVDPELAQLLVVQSEDNVAATLRARLGRLAERAALDAKVAEIVALERDRHAASGPRHGLERTQKRLEDEIATVRAKAAHADSELYGGKITAVRELQGLQEEATVLRRRIRELEDHVLDVMVELEPLGEADEAMAARGEGLEEEARNLTAALAEAEAALHRELQQAAVRRSTAASCVAPDVLGEYEKLRPVFGGSAVVRLIGSRCEGCPLAMPAMEADRIRRSPAGVASCDECGRIVLH